MERYNEWLKTLSSSERAELLQKPPKERIALIRMWKHRNERARLRSFLSNNLKREEIEHLLNWLDDYAQKRRDELRTYVPLWRRREYTDRDDRRSRLYLLGAAYRRDRGRALSAPTAEEMASLLNQLSEEAKSAIEQRDSGMWSSILWKPPS